MKNKFIKLLTLILFFSMIILFILYRINYFKTSITERMFNAPQQNLSFINDTIYLNNSTEFDTFKYTKLSSKMYNLSEIIIAKPKNSNSIYALKLAKKVLLSSSKSIVISNENPNSDTSRRIIFIINPANYYSFDSLTRTLK